MLTLSTQLIVRAMARGIPKEGEEKKEGKQQGGGRSHQEEVPATGKNAISPDADKHFAKAKEEAEEKAASAPDGAQTKESKESGAAKPAEQSDEKPAGQSGGEGKGDEQATEGQEAPPKSESS